MLEIFIPETELFDEENEEFIFCKEQTLRLEHSLVSISKWESKYEKPFLTKDEKTAEEMRFYIKCMTLTQNVKPETYLCIPSSEIEKVAEYIDSKQTATTFAEDYFNKKESKVASKVVTSEEIYYMMIANGISKEYEKWHINRLITLLRVFEFKAAQNDPKRKKMSPQEIMARNKALNAKRKAELAKMKR